LSTRICPEMLEEISCETIESENPLKMQNFPDFLTRARPGMKNQAIFWTEMVFTDVFYLIGPRNFELNKLQRHWRFFRVSPSSTTAEMGLEVRF
jgi:hypothetical protein